MDSKLFNFKLFLFIFLFCFIGGCKNNKTNQEPTLLIVDSTNIDSQVADLDIYFLKYRGSYISYKNNNFVIPLKKLNIKGISKYEAVSYYNCKLIPNQILRDLIYINKKVEKILIIIKDKDDTISYKIVNNKIKEFIKVSLLGNSIKVNTE